VKDTAGQGNPACPGCGHDPPRPLTASFLLCGGLTAAAQQQASVTPLVAGTINTVTRTNPRKINGPWADGRVLDLHSSGSEFLGYDEFGHEQFDTRRTEVGELLYRLKYRNDATAIDEIGIVAGEFIRSWRVEFEVIVPAPPTRARRVQPLHQIADELARRFEVPVVKAVTKNAAGAAELKDLREFHERQAVLEGALSVNAAAIAGKRVLLVGDLIRSGATLGAVATALSDAGAAIIFAFALTKTRRV
jgi:competence protein ComFC